LKSRTCVARIHSELGFQTRVLLFQSVTKTMFEFLKSKNMGKNTSKVQSAKFVEKTYSSTRCLRRRFSSFRVILRFLGACAPGRIDLCYDVKNNQKVKRNYKKHHI
jgi:hypothetical protein